MGKMITEIGPSGNGPALDKHRGYDIVSSDVGALSNPEWQKVNGTFAANTAKTISFIYATHNVIPPTIQVNAKNTAAISIHVYACCDRIERPDHDQDETQDLRAATWNDITANYLVFGAAGSAALASTAAAFSSKLLAPITNAALALRPTFIKVTFTVDGAQGADAIDMFSHGTSR